MRSGKTEAQDIDSAAAFLLILGHQFVGQIGVAHAVQVRHTFADETVGLGAIKEIQRGVQGEPRFLRESLHRPKLHIK